MRGFSFILLFWISLLLAGCDTRTPTPVTIVFTNDFESA